MKYITTDKHPEFKKGIEIVKHIISLIGVSEYKTTGGYGVLTIPEFKHDLEKGYIKEVEEKEFTKRDMMNFALFHRDVAHRINNTLDEWLKQR